MKRALAFSAAMAVLSGSAAHAASGPVATLPVGKVEGVRLGETDVFRGIPFAQAPVGDLRYLADVSINEIATPIAKAQLATALALVGDKARAERVYVAALAAIPARPSSLETGQ